VTVRVVSGREMPVWLQKHLLTAFRTKRKHNGEAILLASLFVESGELRWQSSQAARGLTEGLEVWLWYCY
jgi:hypothetical protein